MDFSSNSENKQQSKNYADFCPRKQHMVFLFLNRLVIWWKNEEGDFFSNLSRARKRGKYPGMNSSNCQGNRSSEK